jgi:hypothetical protein
MKFRLEKKAAGPTLAKFYVMDASGATCGIITVGAEQAEDLLKHWNAAPAPAAKAAARDKAAAGREAIVRALRAGPRLSKAALLRS